MSRRRYHSGNAVASPTVKVKKITSRFCPEAMESGKTVAKSGRHCQGCGCKLPTAKDLLQQQTQ